MMKLHHDIVQSIVDRRARPQASESSKKIHNVMTWRQFAFHYIKCLEKRMIKNKLQ